MDAALRPEGKLGPLVRTLASHQAYYAPLGPDLGVPGAAQGAAGRRRPRPRGRVRRDAGAAGVDRGRARALRRRRAGDAPAGRGHPAAGRRRPGDQARPGRAARRRVRRPAAAAGARTGGRVAARRRHARGARGAVRRRVRRAGRRAPRSPRRTDLLRTVEHRLQLQRLRRTHLVPDDATATAPAGAGWPGRWATGRTPAATRSRCSPRSGRCTPARCAGCTRSCSTGRCCTRWPGCRATSCGCPRSRRPAGWRRSASPTPDGALRHLSALTAGVSRRAVIQRALLPVVLHELADAPDPDAGLLAYRTVSEALGNSPWYLRFLRDEGQVTERLAQLLGTSRYVAELLEPGPGGAADPRRRRRAAAAAGRGAADLVPGRRRPARGPGRGGRRRPGAAPAGAAADRRRRRARAARRRPRSARRSPTWSRRRSEAALDAAVRTVELSRGAMPTRVAVIAMGRLGGAETGYGSDADVLFVHDPLPGADEPEADRGRERGGRGAAPAARAARAGPAAAGGRGAAAGGAQRAAGPHARRRTQAYYRRWSSPWEAQALLRAAPLAGDPALGSAFVELVDPLRYPADGLTPAADHRDPPAQGADGRRAAAPRRRPGHAHQARPRRAGRRRVDRAAAAAAARRAGARAADHPDAAGAGRRPGRRPARAGRHRGAGGGVADRDPGPQRGRAGPRPAVGPAARARARTWPGSCGWSATRPDGTRASSWTTTAAPPAAPAQSSSASSTTDPHRARRRTARPVAAAPAAFREPARIVIGAAGGAGRGRAWRCRAVRTRRGDRRRAVRSSPPRGVLGRRSGRR